MTARLEVICGPMFSGKTEELIFRLNRARFARKRIRVLKPADDTRTPDFIASRATDTDGTDGNPFGPVPGLMAIADDVEKLTGVCMVCGAEGANHSQRLDPSAELIKVGDLKEYEVRCRKCFVPQSKQ